MENLDTTMNITPTIIKLASDIYNLERQKEVIDAELKPKREELLEKITDYGIFQAGDHTVTKTHFEATHIKAFDRRPYDTIKVK